MIVLKNIPMTLDPESVEEAIREVELFESELKPAMQCLINYLAEKGVEIARAHLLFVGRDSYTRASYNHSIYSTGALSESIKYTECDENGNAYITAGEGLETRYGSYAMFVEYGTGIVGKGTYPGENPGYEYDVHHNGKYGWFYPLGTDRYSIRWTKGMPAKPFMYNTLRELETEADVQGAKIIAEYIRGERA